MSLTPQAAHNETLGTVLIMAGGTGGHIFPALSIARNLQSRGYRTEWLGTERGLEREVLQHTDIPLHFIKVRGLRGKGAMSIVLAPFMILGAVLQSLKVVRAVNPCCVLGMGGYVTGPGGVAAKLSGRKLLIHEQNAIAGFSNRLLARIADRVMEAFPGTFAARDAVVCTGNPVRADILALAAPEHRKRSAGQPLRVLVLGGSLGAAAINRLLPAALQQMSAESRPDVLHQCGRSNLDETRLAYQAAEIELNDKVKVEPFINDMAAAYAWTDLVICRAGALTVSEIAAVGVPSILIPFPHAVDDHQTRNAQWLSSAGAAVLVQQADLTAPALALRLQEYSNNRTTLAAMASAARGLAQPHACDLVVRECMEACKGK